MMKRNVKTKLACLLVGAMTLAATACGGGKEKKEYAITVHLPDGKMAMVHEDLKEYLTANFDASVQIAVNTQSWGSDLQTSCLSFSGGDCNSYVVKYSTEEDMTPCYTRRIKANGEGGGSIYFGTLIPNTTYYVQVVSAANTSVCSEVVSFTTEDCKVRTLRILDSNGYGPRNVRDAGGYEVACGGRVKYGMVYRGVYINQRGANDRYALTTETRNIMKNELSIRTEIDLRTSGVDDIDESAKFPKPQTENQIDGNLPYYKLTMGAYESVFSDGESKESIKGIFETLAEKSNYPTYVHCNAGADRTGTIIFLLHGILGVSYEDAVRNYELTNFSPQGQFGRYLRLPESEGPPADFYAHFAEFYEGLLAYGDDFHSATEAFIRSIGVTGDVIEAVRANLIEK